MTMPETDLPAPASAADRAKDAAAARAVALVADGMRLGIGTGSTADWMTRRLGQRVRTEGLRVTGVPTSTRTARLAADCGIPLATLEEAGWLDLTIDGADEFDGALNLVKGGGGALLHEKIVAAASDRMVVIADAGKRVARLGAFPLPVEVIPFGWQSTRRLIERLLAAEGLAASIALREAGGAPYATDEGNRILDLSLGAIPDAPRLAAALNRIPGVVENGLFTGLCTAVILGHEDGRTEAIGPAADLARLGLA